MACALAGVFNIHGHYQQGERRSPLHLNGKFANSESLRLKTEGKNIQIIYLAD